MRKNFRNRFLRAALAAILLAALVVAFPAAACAADAATLAPNAKITLEFPDLPDTFFTQSTGEKRAAILTAQLPENYTREGRFPIFVFINGGSGGRGTDNTARSIVGTRDFITVSVPLFKDAVPANPPKFTGVSYNPAQLILPSDAAVLGRAYRVMFQKLAGTVPNIAVERSTLGGFSNGAHAASALVAAKDEYILGHFTAFCFYEGGMALVLDPAALAQPALKRARLIMLFGDADKSPGRKVAEPILAALMQEAAKQQLDLTHIVMKGYGHTMPKEYSQMLGQWVRGEPLTPVK